MIKSVFKKTIFFSILSHLAVFGMFSFSFGPRIAPADYAVISFWGRILPNSELINNKNFNSIEARKSFLVRTHALPAGKTDKVQPLLSDYYLKPQATLVFNREKIIFAQKLPPVSPLHKKKEQAIMFHPRLPYHFLLFFTDRQAVHIELMFSIISRGKMNSIAVKRKISSGNLEADLLGMRYISRYLFIEQARFQANNWQTVKIDLSAKND